MVYYMPTCSQIQSIAGGRKEEGGREGGKGEGGRERWIDGGDVNLGQYLIQRQAP